MQIKQSWTLVKDAVSAWVDDYAPSMGAALAYYSLFSVAPLLIIVIGVAGLVFGQDAAQGAIVGQLRGLIGDEGAVAVEGLLKSVSKPAQGVVAIIVGLLTLIIGATTVFAELQSSLDRIWRSPAVAQSTAMWALIRTRLLSFGMVLGVGFLLLVSLVVSAALGALGKWWEGLLGGWEILLAVVNFVGSFGVITGLFAAIYKFMPRVKIAWRDVWVGAAVTAFLFTIGKFLIGQYLGRSGVTSGFGAAGSIVVLLVWFYFAAQIFLLGAEFTWVYARSHGSRAGVGAPQPAATVPSRSDQAALEVDHSFGATPSKTARREAPTAAALALATRRGTSELPVREFIEQHPIKGLGLVITLGLLMGGILRRAAPPAKLFPRRAAAPRSRLAEVLPEKPLARLAPHKPSLFGRLAEKWWTRARPSVFRELLGGATARLLTTEFVKRRMAARRNTSASADRTP